MNLANCKKSKEFVPKGFLLSVPELLKRGCYQLIILAKKRVVQKLLIIIGLLLFMRCLCQRYSLQSRIHCACSHKYGMMCDFKSARNLSHTSSWPYRVNHDAANPAIPEEFRDGIELLKLRTYPKTPRSAVCDKCFQYTYNTVLRPKSCEAAGDITILILITTVPSASAQRNALRRTWLSLTGCNTKSLRYFFLLGSGWPAGEEATMEAENHQFGDILLDDFVDSYVNLSMKVMAGFRFTLNSCQRAQYVIRTADDNYLNLPNIFQMIEQRADMFQDTIIGECWEEGAVVIRDKMNKWAVSFYEWIDDTYPPYCTGTTYLMTLKTMETIFRAAEDVPFFVLEDVYFGLVANLCHISQLRTAHFGLPVPVIDQANEADPCGLDPHWRSLHPVNITSMYLIWNYCPQSKQVSSGEIHKHF